MPNKTLVDNTSIQNKDNGGNNRAAITFATNTITLSGTSSGTKCSLGNIADPSSASDAASKAYVDQKTSELSTGLSWKDPVQAKQATNLDGTFTAGALQANVDGNLPAVDGVTLSVGQRLLLSGQTDKSQNGIYTVQSVGDDGKKGGSPLPWQILRATDSDSVEDLKGATTTVLRGNTYSGTVYVQKNTLAAMTDDIEWVQTSSAVNEISATDGLTKTGPYVSVATDGTSIGIVSDKVSVLADGISATEIAPGAVEQAAIAAGACGTVQIEDGSVTSVKLSGNIDGSKIADDTLTSNLYAPQSVDAAALKLRSVTTQIIGLDAVESDNIKSGAVGSDALDTASVDGGVHIAPGSLVSSNYAANSVNNAALGPSSVGTIQLLNNSVTTSKINSGQITTSLLDNTAGQQAVDTETVRDKAITNRCLSLSCVSEDRIQDGACSQRCIADGAINSAKFGTITSLDVQGQITANSIVLGGAGGSLSTFQLAKVVFNQIHLDADYHFTGSYKRICDNLVSFSYADKVLACTGQARLIYQSSSGHSGTLGFVFAARFWNSTGSAPLPYAEPVAFDTFSVGFADTRQKEGTLSGFAVDNDPGVKRYIHSIGWWAKETSGNNLIIPSGQDFVSNVMIVNDSSEAQEERWDGTSLSSA